MSPRRRSPSEAESNDRAEPPSASMLATLATRAWLRPVARRDLDDYARLFCDATIAQFDETTLVLPHELPGIFDGFDRRRPGDPGAEYAITDTEGGPLLGVISETPQAGLLFLGYHMLPAARGRGLATAAVCEYLRLHAGDRRAVLRLAIDPRNEPSRRVALRAGFVRVGERVASGSLEELWGLRDLG